MRYYQFPSSIVFEVTGDDSPRYLNARLSNDISKLPIGSILFAAALTAQGKVEGLFSVCRLEAKRFFLISDGGDKKSIKEAVGRFIVADRVVISDLSDKFTLLHIFDDPMSFIKTIFGVTELASSSFSTHLGDTGTTLLYMKQRTGPVGLDLLVQKEYGDRFIQKFQTLLSTEVSTDEFLLLRLKAGKPVFPDEINSESILSEVGLDDAISSTKGCYVGQEVIERIRSRGKPPRILVRILLSGNTSVEKDTLIFGGEHANVQIGKVISSAFDSERGETICFAFVRNELPPGEVLIKGLKAKIVH